MTSKKKTGIKPSPALKARYANLKPIKTKPQFLVWLLHENPYSLDGQGWKTECIVASQLLKKFPNWDFWLNFKPNFKPRSTFESLKIPLKNNSFYNKLLKEEYSKYESVHNKKYLEYIEKKAKLNKDTSSNKPQTGSSLKIKNKFDFLE